MTYRRSDDEEWWPYWTIHTRAQMKGIAFTALCTGRPPLPPLYDPTIGRAGGAWRVMWMVYR